MRLLGTAKHDCIWMPGVQEQSTAICFFGMAPSTRCPLHPQSRHSSARIECPLCANKRHRAAHSRVGQNNFHYFKFSALPGVVFTTLIRSCPDSASKKLTVSPCFSTFMQGRFGPSLYSLETDRGRRRYLPARLNTQRFCKVRAERMAGSSPSISARTNVKTQRPERRTYRAWVGERRDGISSGSCSFSAAS